MVKNKDLNGMGLDPQPKKEPERKNRDFKKYINKKTITITTMSALVLGGIVLSTNVDAQNAVRETANEISVTVMKTRHSSDFENKAVLQENEAIQAESKQALDKITAEWTDNSADEIRAEVERQREAGLDAYVVQWGDTLEVLAEVLNTTVDELVARNNISDRHLILAGDILDGVLYQTTNADRLSDEEMVGVSTDLSHLQESESENPDDNPEFSPADGEAVENPDAPVSNENDVESDDLDEGGVEAVDEAVDGNEGEGVTGEQKPAEDIAEPAVERPTKELTEEDLDDFGVLPIDPTADVQSEESDVFVGEDPDSEPLEVPDEQIDIYVVSVVTEQVDEEIPFKTEVIEDDELAEDQRIVETAGTVGLAVTSTEVSTLSDGSTRKGEAVREVVLEPINEVVRVGTLPIAEVKEESEEYVREVLVDYEVEEIEVDDLGPGERRVTQPGEYGVRYELVKDTFDSNGNFMAEEVVEENFEGERGGETYKASEPVKEIVEVGKEIEYDRIEEEVREVKDPIPVMTKTVEAGEPLIDRHDNPILDINGDPLVLLPGEEYVEEEGSHPIVKRTFKVYYKDGVEDPVYEEMIHTDFVPEENFVDVGSFKWIHQAK